VLRCIDVLLTDKSVDRHLCIMDISMDIHAKSVDMDMDMDGKFHIHGNPDNLSECLTQVPRALPNKT